MNLFFLHHPIEDLINKTDEHTLVPLQEPQHDITEGGEFLDDAIRMKDQPLTYTEELQPEVPKDQNIQQ